MVSKPYSLTLLEIVHLNTPNIVAILVQVKPRFLKSSNTSEVIQNFGRPTFAAPELVISMGQRFSATVDGVTDKLRIRSRISEKMVSNTIKTNCNCSKSFLFSSVFTFVFTTMHSSLKRPTTLSTSFIFGV